MKTYAVTAALKFPSCYHSGYSFTIHALNKAEAIKFARRDAAREGHTRQDGPLIYTAQEIDQADANFLDALRDPNSEGPE